MGGRLRVRRLTLAPSRGLLPVDGDDLLQREADKILGQEQLARSVELIAGNNISPDHRVHGVEKWQESRSWVADVESSDDESVDTPGFIRHAGEVGYSVSQLVEAENDISEPNYSKLGEHSMAKRIIDDMVAATVAKSRSKPWSGPLPPPRRSPPMTFGAALNKAKVLFRGTHWLRFWSEMQRREEDKDLIINVCRQLEALVMQIFAHHGWRFSNRISYT
ncbi:unnamed protein product [Urochloa humidicola]